MDPVEVREEQVRSSDPLIAPAQLAPRDGYVQPGERRVYTSRRAFYPVGWRATSLVWLSLCVVEVFLGLDFIFRLAGAVNVGFAHIVFVVGRALAVPFAGIFAASVRQGGYVADWNDLVAMAIYAVAAWVVVTLVRVAVSRDTTRRVA